MTLGTPESLTPVTSQHAHPGTILAREGGVELLLAVIGAHEVWSKLTRPQRAALTDPTKDVNPRTLAALARKGLWADGGRTPYGDQVVRFSSASTTGVPE